MVCIALRQSHIHDRDDFVAKILVIDDDAPVLEFFRQVLDGRHEVTTAANGEDGLRLCRKQPFDVVVTDIYMPFIDGLELLRELGRNAPQVKIIVMTGKMVEGASSYLKLAKDLGAAEVLAKPFTQEQLVTAVEKALSA